MQIAYREIYPGIEVFDCAPLRATLGRTACADNYLQRRCVGCWDCAVGQHHAGIKKDAPPRPKKVCIRCGSTNNQRLIAASLCPSCHARQTELLRGRNSKGCWPAVIARQLRWVHAIVQLRAGIKQPEHNGFTANYARSGLPKMEPIEPGFFFLRMVATGRTEFEAWLSRHHPTGEIVDYDEHASFAVIHSPENSAQ